MSVCLLRTEQASKLGCKPRTFDDIIWWRTSTAVLGLHAELSAVYVRKKQCCPAYIMSLLIHWNSHLTTTYLFFSTQSANYVANVWLPDHSVNQHNEFNTDHRQLPWAVGLTQSHNMIINSHQLSSLDTVTRRMTHQVRRKTTPLKHGFSERADLQQTIFQNFLKQVLYKITFWVICNDNNYDNGNGDQLTERRNKKDDTGHNVSETQSHKNHRQWRTTDDWPQQEPQQTTQTASTKWDIQTHYTHTQTHRPPT